ncbi:MAG TPA: PQQ-binding-like beta-propeller repeat protein [Solirubrobacteraceae bacterium]|nr:PQQ-binding-like beta-propeller repeat protein [Solirubrobacteraceae bacterium]
MRVRVAALTLVAALAGGSLMAPSALAASSDQAVAYQLDAAHDGYQDASPITTPLSQAWSVNLGGSISYPLIVNGIVYVTAAGSGGGTTLYAIEQATGATLWSHALGGTYAWSGLAYDAGLVFTVNSDGTLTAFDAGSGASVWSLSLPGQTLFTSPPTAFDGYVYTGGAGGGGDVYAVSEATGALVWEEPVENGDDSSPAVDSSDVYVTYACDQDYDFDPFTGAQIWHHTSSCEGGGGSTPVLAGGDVFGRDATNGNVVLSASSGATLGSFTAGPAPAVGGGDAYTVSGGALTAVAGSGLGNTAWTFTGDGKIDSAPIVVGNLVFAGSSGGNLYALDAASGATDWSTTLASGVPAPEEGQSSQPLTGLAAGEGTLIVPTGSELVAFTGANVGSGTPTESTGPSVVGTPVVGQPVGADVGTWSGLPTSYTFQWLDCDGGTCSDITGANTESYTPTSAQLGHALEVSVTATNASGTSSAVVSGPSNAIVAPPTISQSPTIGGTAADGQTLTASPGSWNGNPTGYSYQWLRCQSGSCSPVSGATLSTYAVTAADIGSQLKVQVTAVNPAGAGSASSQPTSTVPTDATTLRLTSSVNPVKVGNSVVFTATMSPSVDGGTVSFSQDGDPATWCQAMPVGGSTQTVTCGGTAGATGEISISATYSGDPHFNASTSSLTEDIVDGSSTSTTPGTPPAPPTVSLEGTPSATSTTPTIYYRESGTVNWTLCNLDGKYIPCDTTHAVLPKLSYGTHQFTVEVENAGGSSHAEETWKVVAAGTAKLVTAHKLSAPKNLRGHRVRGGILLTWSAVSGARSYVLSVTVGGATRRHNLGAGAHSFTVKLRRRARMKVTLKAVGSGGAASAATRLSLSR